MDEEALVLKTVVEFFLNSHDYNGIPATRLAEDTDLDYHEVLQILKRLVSVGDISIQVGANPHIIHIQHYTVDKQLKYLDIAKDNVTTKYGAFISSDSHLLCAYPSKFYLHRNRNVEEFIGRPYEMQLAYGEPNLKPTFFKMEVLERYSNDPRYRFDLEDYSGEIWYEVDENEHPLVDEADESFLKSFGLGIDSEGNTVVVAYICYLKGLTAEHQTYWQSKEIKKGCQMLPEYYENTVQARWTTSYSIFSAFVAEQKALNDICFAIFKKPLFAETFEERKRPNEFNFLFMPTLRNYNDFIHLLDKMISENINKDLFDGIERYSFTPLKDGSVERTSKGSLRLLEEWLHSAYTTTESAALSRLIEPFKKVRKQRQHPAHKINFNVYDLQYINQQSEIIVACWDAMQTLRKIFQRHPLSVSVEIPEWLDTGTIKSFGRAGLLQRGTEENANE